MVWLVHNHTVFRRLLDLGDNDCSLVTVRLVESRKLLERVVADDIRVQNKEGLIVLSENLLGELQRARGTQRLRFDREGDPDIELLFVL